MTIASCRVIQRLQQDNPWKVLGTGEMHSKYLILLLIFNWRLPPASITNISSCDLPLASAKHLKHSLILWVWISYKQTCLCLIFEKNISPSFSSKTPSNFPGWGKGESKIGNLAVHGEQSKRNASQKHMPLSLSLTPVLPRCNTEERAPGEHESVQLLPTAKR